MPGPTVEGMDLKVETREFLATRRARITPGKAGLPAYGGNRRVPGLRREEVAMLAGVSVDYYTRLERGNLGGVSGEVLDALAEALQLDEAEHGHLIDLARAANTSGAARRRARRAPAPILRPVIQRILDSMDGAPAFVRNGRLDVLGANTLSRALYVPLYDSPERIATMPVNTARFQFLDPEAAQAFWGDRTARMAHDAVAILRAEAGKHPYDTSLTALVGELSTRSEDFRRLWASHDVRYHRSGTKVFHHPAVGALELDFEALLLPADPGLQLNVYTAAPGSPSDDGLTLLASWAATTAEETSASRARRAPHTEESDTHAEAAQARHDQEFSGAVHRRRLARPPRDATGGRPANGRRPRAVRSRRAHRLARPRAGQTLLVTSGVALVQSRGSGVVEVHPGERVYCPPGEEHWHGATPEDFMEHLAMSEAADGPAESTVWLEHVTDAEYDAR